MRIPVIMSHSTTSDEDLAQADTEYPLSAEYFRSLILIARELGFESISYDQLDSWFNEEGELPSKPIMFDFDHPMKSIFTTVAPILREYSFSGNLFINTGMMAETEEQRVPRSSDYWTKSPCMSWDDIGELHQQGWTLGAHTHSHPGLPALAANDPGGNKVLFELNHCDELIEKYTGVIPRDFAFTGTSFSEVVEQLVMQRYRFSRLWITGPEYESDSGTIRFAELAGSKAPDEADGGPPHDVRYITRGTNPYRLPSMEIQSPLMYKQEDFRAYLLGAQV